MAHASERQSSLFGTVSRSPNPEGNISCPAHGSRSLRLCVMPWTWQCLACNTLYPLTGTKVCFDDGVRLSAGNVSRTRLFPPREYDMMEQWETHEPELPGRSVHSCYLHCPFPGFCRLYELLDADEGEEEYSHHKHRFSAGIETSVPI